VAHSDRAAAGGRAAVAGASARRCYKLGQAVRRGHRKLSRRLSVAIVATGGLSHQVHGERAGFNNTAWDAQFLDLIESDPARIAEMTQAELAALGVRRREIIMWLVMRGATFPGIRRTHRAYYLPSMTGIATAIYENQATPPIAGEAQRHRQHMANNWPASSSCQAPIRTHLRRASRRTD